MPDLVLLAQTNAGSGSLFNPQKKSLAQTGELGNVNQGASTIPLFHLGM